MQNGPAAAAQASQPDWFSVLGVKRAFFPLMAEIDKSYFELSRANHPDRVLASKDAAKIQAALSKMSEVNEAYQGLKSEPTRVAHLLVLLGFADFKSKGVPALALEWFEVQDEPSQIPSFAVKLSQTIELNRAEVKTWMQEFDRTSDLSLLPKIAEAVSNQKTLTSLQADVQSRLGVGK